MHIGKGRDRIPGVLNERTERGIVVAVSGGKATVELEAHSGCDACNLCHRTGSGKMTLEVDAPEGLATGAGVRIANASPSSWAGSILLFLLPLAGLLAGLAVGANVFEKTVGGRAAAAALGVGGLVLFLSAGFVFDRRLSRRPRPKPRIVEIR